MSEPPPPSKDSSLPRKAQPSTAGLARQVSAKAKRKLAARGTSSHSVWLGLGMMGLIGWSVVVPTLLGAALGIWLDHRGTSSHSWTIALLFAGLALGCLSAWHWVAKEDKAMHDKDEDNE